MTDSIKYKLANLNSAIFNPLIWPSLMFIIITFHYTNIFQDFLFTSIICIIFVSIIPLITVKIWSRYKETDMDLYNKEDRHIPSLISTLSCLFCTIILYQINNNLCLVLVMLSYFFNMLLIYVITYKWKISIHSISASSSIPFLICAYGYAGFLSVIPLFLTMWSRLYLKKHTFAQVIAGASLGLILSILIIFFLLKI